MKRKSIHMLLVVVAGLMVLALGMTKSTLSMERFRKISLFQKNLNDQSEQQMRAVSPLWHAITRRFLP